MPRDAEGKSTAGVGRGQDRATGRGTETRHQRTSVPPTSRAIRSAWSASAGRRSFPVLVGIEVDAVTDPGWQVKTFGRSTRLRRNNDCGEPDGERIRRQMVGR